MKKLILILFIVLLSIRVWGANCGTAGSTYYIAAAPTGATTNAGTLASPWLHSPRDANAAGNEVCTLQSGDTVIYRRGDTWYDTMLTLNVASIIHTSNNTFYKTADTDALPILSGAYDPSTLSWNIVGSIASTTNVATAPNTVVWNDTRLTASTADCNAIELNKYKFAASTAGACVANTFYVNVGADPSTGTLEVSKRNSVILFSAALNTVSNLHLRVNQQTTSGIVYTNSKDSETISGCTVKHSAATAIYAMGTAGSVGSYTISNNMVSGSVGASSPAIYIRNAYGVSTVTGNTVTVGTLYGIQAQNTGTNTLTISNNTIHDITSGTSGICITSGGVSGGIYSNTIYSIAGASNGITIGNDASNINITIGGTDASKANIIYGVNTAINIGGASLTGMIVAFNTIGNATAGNHIATYGISASNDANIYSNTFRNCDTAIYYDSCTSGANIYSNDIQDSYISGSSNMGIYIAGGSSANVYQNTIKNMWNGLNYGDTPSGNGAGIKIAGTTASCNVYNNLVYNNYDGIADAATGDGGNKIYYNSVFNSVVNSIDLQQSGTNADMVYNNMIVHSPHTALGADATGHGLACQITCAKAKFVNNIIYIKSLDANGNAIMLVYRAGYDITLDNNAIYPLATNARLIVLGSFPDEGLGNPSGVYTTVAAAKTALLKTSHVRNNAGTTNLGCANCVSGDPLVVSTTTPDFHLQSGSPAIDAGVDVGLSSDYDENFVPQGNAPDIGAYEYLNVTYSDFDSISPNLNTTDTSNITNLTIKKSEYGKINFIDNVNISNGADLNTYINISHNYIFINSTALPSLNVSANLTLYNLTFSNPRILKDGAICPSSICNKINYSSGILVFNVTSFSAYSSEETTSSGSSSGGSGRSEGSSNELQQSVSIVGAKANEFKIFDFSKDIDIKSIIVYFKNDVKRSYITVEKFEYKPQDVSEPEGKTYSYLRISKDIRDEDYEDILIRFIVPRTWINQNNILSNEIKLKRFNNKWETLKTTMISSDNNYYYYESESDSMSYFAISTIKKSSSIIPETDKEIKQDIQEELLITKENIEQKNIGLLIIIGICLLLFIIYLFIRKKINKREINKLGKQIKIDYEKIEKNLEHHGFNWKVKR